MYHESLIWGRLTQPETQVSKSILEKYKSPSFILMLGGGGRRERNVAHVNFDFVYKNAIINPTNTITATTNNRHSIFVGARLACLFLLLSREYWSNAGIQKLN